MSIEGQGHFFTIYLPGFVCFVLYLAKISGERLQDHWSSGLRVFTIYGPGGHLGHVTSIMSSDFHFLVPESFHKKFSSDRHSSF